MKLFLSHRYMFVVLSMLFLTVSNSLNAQCSNAYLSQDQLQFSLNGGSTSISLNGCSNPIITFYPAPSWLSLSASGNTITVSCTSTSSYRTEMVPVRVNGIVVDEFSVTQGTPPPPDPCTVSGLSSPILDLDPMGGVSSYSISFSNCSSTYLTFQTTSGGPIPNSAWFTISQPNTSTVTIQSNINDTNSSRSFIILAFRNGEEVIATQLRQDSCWVNWYPDTDGDTYGDVHGTAISSCTEPPAQNGISYVQNNDDFCPLDPNMDNYGCPSNYVHEDMNWITAKTYDINGTLKSSSKAYFNELGKGIQSQSVNFKGNTPRTWATSTLYDAQGRPALSTLSAPINNSGTFTYNPNFIKNEVGTNYTISDFEGINNNIDKTQNPTPIGTATNTLGWYYSPLNTDTHEPGNNYQDVTDYPFSRTIYSELNPGATLKTIGGNKQNGTWKQGYTFSMPAGQELSCSKAFNDVAYNTIKTIKTVSKDVHDNEIVVFTDTDGKTLAAARVRGTLNPDSTVDIGTQGFVDVHVPQGTTGFTINGVSGMTTEVYNLITEQVTTTATTSLSNGFYRVSITNLDSYNPTTPATTVSVTYHDNYYDYSLNEYDEAGRLIASYQPVGNTKSQKPVTTYSYNALGQLLSTTSPDEGTANFKYRNDGQIRFSQNSKQLAVGEFSYTNYDDLGRPIESGVATGTFLSLNADTSVITTSIAAEKQETFYDTLADVNNNGVPNELETLLGVSYKPSFLAGNVAKTKNTNTTSWYSYDVYGRVKWIVQNINGLGAKTIDYEYDPITSQVNKVVYQKNQSDQFIHRYTYDNIDNSLVKVETSIDGTTYKTHANYKYYETGALKRIELAPQNNTGTPLQNIDYVYNLNGQLKAINPGNDVNDLFSMQIDYHDDDYKRSVSNISTPNYGENRYNGNIKGIRWKNKELINSDQTYSYYYNKNNWLSNAVYGQYDDIPGDGSSINIVDNNIHQGTNKVFNATNSIIWLPGFYAKPNSGQEVTAKIVTGTASKFQKEDYNVFDITYDANGNIQTLNRNKNGGVGNNAMDQLSYSYNPNKPNQLQRVLDAAGEVLPEKDLGNQKNAENYVYNEIGQLIENKEEKITYIYNTSGLVTEVKQDNQTRVKFFYNDKGHRVRKESYIAGSSNLDYVEHYIRDAAGIALAIYKDGQATEHTIYGASRLGVYNRNGGSSYYQLTDHLGNVRAVTGRASNGTPLAIVSATDYYPFGMPMPFRDNGTNSYRYAYQGQEKDPETGKEAFELRLWDSRIGRWLTTDPAGQYSSPYLGMGNNPINGVDPDGGEFFTKYKLRGGTKDDVVEVNDGIDLTFEVDEFDFAMAKIFASQINNFRPDENGLVSFSVNYELNAAYNNFFSDVIWNKVDATKLNVLDVLFTRPNLPESNVIGSAPAGFELIGGGGSKFLKPGYTTISKIFRSGALFRTGKASRFTEFGYQLSKHADLTSRPNPAFWRGFLEAGAKLSPKAWNQAGSRAFRHIIRNGKVHNTGKFFEIRLPSGSGIRLQHDLKFKGFLD